MELSQAGDVSKVLGKSHQFRKIIKFQHFEALDGVPINFFSFGAVKLFNANDAQTLQFGERK